MSATLDPNKYMEYFKTNALIKVQGRKFPIKVFNIAEEKEEEINSLSKNINQKKELDYYDLISKYIDRCLNCILQIILSEKEEDKYGDILVFLPGQEDIEDLQELLKSKKEEINTELPNGKNIEFKVLPLFGSLPSNQQLKIFRPLKNKYGKNIRIPVAIFLTLSPNPMCQYFKVRFLYWMQRYIFRLILTNKLEYF